MARGIDHLVLDVRDLEAARDVYSRLGFTCTPRAQHGWGTANFLVQLQGSFLEILTVDRPELLTDPEDGAFSFGRFNEVYLESREGFAMLVLESRDSDADQEDFKARGLQTYAPFGFSRQAKLPSGDEVTVSFSLRFVTDPHAPGIGFFTCEQYAPEFFWKSEYQTHANGARAVYAIDMISEHPTLHRSFLEAFSGANATDAVESYIAIETPRGILRTSTMERARDLWGSTLEEIWSGHPMLAGYVVEVDRLDQTRDIFRTNDVAFDDLGNRLVVAPSLTFGVGVAFAEQP